MKFLKVMIVIAVVIGMNSIFVPKAKSQTLDIVFQSTMWGGAIGGVGGFALWALQDKDPVDDVPKYMLRGSAIGIFFGMGFGLYEGTQGGVGGGDVFGQAPAQKGLLHYNSRAHQLAIRPDRLITPVTLYAASASKQTLPQLKLFSAEF